MPRLRAHGAAGGVYDDPAFVSRLEAEVPMGRIVEVSDLRHALPLLASAASDYMAGHALVVDGGGTAG